MSRYALPVPRVARPIAPIDPYRNRDAYIRILSALYHAEAAALEGFSLLEDPNYVQSSELFARASRRLIEDETKHLQDIEGLVQKLGAPGVVPPTPAMAEFWTAWRSGKLFTLPFKPGVAALFCLFSEGLGFAFLYNLAEATADPDVRAVLSANVEDEKMHLRLSISVLSRALREDDSFLSDVAVYMLGYALLARRAARQQRALLDDVGLDFDVIVGSSLRFVADLIDVVMQNTGQSTRGWQLLHRLSALLGEQPNAIRLLHLSMYLPAPPLALGLVRRWGEARKPAKLRAPAGHTAVEAVVS